MENVIVKADTLLGKAVTDEDGNAVFDLDLPFGNTISKNLQLRQVMYLHLRLWM